MNELDLLINKYAVSIEELKLRRAEDNKIFDAIDKKGYKSTDRHYLGIEYAINQIPIGEIAQALLQDFKETARRKNLFLTAEDVSTGLIDLSGYKIRINENTHNLMSLSSDLKIEPLSQHPQFKFALRKLRIPASITVDGEAVKNNLNGYKYIFEILDYDISKTQTVQLNITEGTKKTTHNIRLPELTPPNPINILTFTQTIPFGKNNEVRQQIRHNGGAEPSYKKQELNVNVSGTTYSGVQSVGSQFPTLYNSFGTDTNSPALIVFNKDANEPKVFPCKVNWNSSYKQTASKATPVGGNGSFSYCFLRLIKDNLYIISGNNNAGSYSFNITSEYNDELVQLVKNNPDTPFLVMLFRNSIPPAYTTYRLFKDL